jgi:peptide methionine sulfoxide reductase msrA/msrB
MNTTVIFAGGCFWCTEHDLKELPGVITAVSGYSGGTIINPTYQNHGDHREAVQVTYDSAIVSYKKLCQFFLDHIDPTDAGGQFYDRGESYKTAIYYQNESEQEIANGLITELSDSGLFDTPIAVQVLPKTEFYNAEDYHQGYADKNPDHYVSYSRGSGRIQFVANTCNIREEKKINWKD